MTPELPGLNKEIRKAKNRFKRRRDQHKHNFYQQALAAYDIAYDVAKDNHWENLCHELFARSDGEMWHDVNQFSNITKASVVQQIHKADGSHDFDDCYFLKTTEGSCDKR